METSTRRRGTPRRVRPTPHLPVGAGGLTRERDGPTFDASGFAHHRDRLLQADVARLFFEGVLRQAKSAPLISKEHFTVDGTLMEAWACLKSFKPKAKGNDDQDPPVGFQVSQRVRKRIEEIFGWMKTIGNASEIAAFCGHLDSCKCVQ